MTKAKSEQLAASLKMSEARMERLMEEYKVEKENCESIKREIVLRTNNIERGMILCIYGSRFYIALKVTYEAKDTQPVLWYIELPGGRVNQNIFDEKNVQSLCLTIDQIMLEKDCDSVRVVGRFDVPSNFEP